MDIEEKDNSSRRRFLKNAGAAVLASVATGQIVRVVEKAEKAKEPITTFKGSEPEQITKLTHYAKDVRHTIEQNRERIVFNPKNGALRVLSKQGSIYDNSADIRKQKARSISVTLSPDGHTLTFVFTFNSGGEEVHINNIPGEILDIEGSGWDNLKSQK